MTRHSHHKESSFGGRWQLWLLFALIIYTPLPLASNRPWALALLGLLTACLFLWVMWTADRPSVLQTWRCAGVPLLLLLLWTGLVGMQLLPLPASWSTGTQEIYGQRLNLDLFPISIDPYSTRLYFAKATILLAIFWLIVSLVNTRRRVISLAKVVVLSGMLQAIIGVLLMTTGASYQLFFVNLEAARAHGTFVSPNQYAGYLEMTLAMGVGLMIAKLNGQSAVNWRQRMHGWLAVLLSEKAMLRLALIIMVVGLVASRSRGGNSAFFASLLITGVLAVILMKRTAGKRAAASSLTMMKTTMMFIVSLVVLDVVIIGGMVGVEKVVQRIENTNLQAQVAETGSVLRNVQKEQSFEERGEAALPALNIVRDFPFFGTGGGTFHLAFPHYRPAEVQGYFDHTHNDYVEIASETGLTGLLLLALAVLHSLWQSLKLFANGDEQLARGMAFASMMGVVSLLMHGAVDFNFQNPANAMLFLIILSLPYLLNRCKINA